MIRPLARTEPSHACMLSREARNENRKYRGSGGVAESFEERKFS